MKRSDSLWRFACGDVYHIDHKTLSNSMLKSISPSTLWFQDLLSQFFDNAMLYMLMMMNTYAHWQHNIYLWLKMSDRKMSDMIDAHSGFFQSVTSIHAMAADLTVSDKHIFLLHIFPTYFPSNAIISFNPKYFTILR